MQGCILPYVPYLLPAGYSLSREEVLYMYVIEKRKREEQKKNLTFYYSTLPKNHILQGFRVKVIGPDDFIVCH